MDLKIPTFSGTTSEESVKTYIEQLTLYCASKSFNDAAKAALIKASVIGPAGAAATAATPVPAAQGGGAGVNIDTTTPVTLWTSTIQWLEAIYHNDTVQQMYKDQLSSMYQGLTESPNAFYTRIRHLVDLGGYADALKDQISETAFINGLNHEISLAI